MRRICQPELLDHLPMDDPGAIQSRRDLRRLNAWMGNARFMAQALNAFLPEEPKQILEIGAGDGTFFLQVAKRLSGGGRIALLDRQNLVKAKTREGLQEIGWEVQSVCEDVFEFLTEDRTNQTSRTGRAGRTYDAIIANLFLHHFSEDQIAELFRLMAEIAPIFIAIEPRRSPLSVFAGKLVWAIGCNSVTRHDVRISIRAGFTGGELSILWPRGWIRDERLAGFSSHLFVANREAAATQYAAARQSADERSVAECPDRSQS